MLDEALAKGAEALLGRRPCKLIGQMVATFLVGMCIRLSIVRVPKITNHEVSETSPDIMFGENGPARVSIRVSLEVCIVVFLKLISFSKLV